LLGVLLVGIVAIQVEVLKLGASIGRSVSLATELQSRNELLRTSVARLSDDQRIMRQAAKLGMYMPGPTEVNFVPGHARNAVGNAISGIRTPDSQTFLAALAAQVTADGVANPTLGSTGSPVPPSSAATLPATGTALSGTGVATPTTSTPTTGAATATTTPVTATTTPSTGSTGTTSTTTSSGTQATAPSSTGGAAAG
jgi:hypothetical protein